jgi:glycine betaine/choline ABC-type transport system substrate-binding protein
MRERYHLELLKTFGLNNTYALCLRKGVAREHRLQTISDLQRVPQLRVVVDLSFLERPDGWRGLVTKYGLQFRTAPRQVAPDILYRALEAREADLVVGFATDWQIAAMDLVVLEDDRGYFPSYHGAPLARQDLLNEHPEVGKVLNLLHNQIDDEAMRRLNLQVAREKRARAAVAREFLQERGLLRQQ